MIDVTILNRFVEKFVRAESRERFIHEAIKKPRKLHERICHNTSGIFENSLCKGHIQYAVPEKVMSEACFVLSGGAAFYLCTWNEIRHQIGSGDGLLIIDASGDRFYAETEAGRHSPYVVYAGHDQ